MPYQQNQTASPSPAITWMIREDLAQVVDIEAASFIHPWGEEGILKALKERDHIGMVHRFGSVVGGYVIYKLHKTRLHVANLAVRPSLRRCLVGKAIVAKLISKLDPKRRTAITVNVAEANLAGHLFAKAMGFKALRVLPDYFGAGNGDAYAFEYRTDRHLQWATIENRLAMFYK